MLKMQLRNEQKDSQGNLRVSQKMFPMQFEAAASARSQYR